MFHRLRQLLLPLGGILALSRRHARLLIASCNACSLASGELLAARLNPLSLLETPLLNTHRLVLGELLDHVWRKFVESRGVLRQSKIA